MGQRGADRAEVEFATCPGQPFLPGGRVERALLPAQWYLGEGSVLCSDSPGGGGGWGRLSTAISCVRDTAG